MYKTKFLTSHTMKRKKSNSLILLQRGNIDTVIKINIKVK